MREGPCARGTVASRSSLMGRPFLTVLTTPIQGAARRGYQALRSSVRPLVRPGVPVPSTSPYPGHFAVTRSIVEGLRLCGADFNFNPRTFSELARVVYAPANEALAQAVSLKQQGKVEYVAAGPVNALFPSEAGGILLSADIDRLFIASEWVRSFYEAEAPQLLRKLRVSPCGVDAGFWSGDGERRREEVVVYSKNADESLCGEVERVIRECRLTPGRIRYGSYQREAFRSALARSRFAVFLSTFETQGLALAEAWSMDVPTLVWDPQGPAEWRGRSFQARSSAPYLTGETGATWRSIAELRVAIERLLDGQVLPQPRRWILANMTDEICARALFKVIEEDMLVRTR